ncbi:hypothetical protein RJ55_06261 [Drechmeria coniospora]|nr:hypothetical protein RJ55_06261 [Drechmeria coniospora]
MGHHRPVRSLALAGSVILRDGRGKYGVLEYMYGALQNTKYLRIYGHAVAVLPLVGASTSEALTCTTMTQRSAAVCQLIVPTLCAEHSTPRPCCSIGHGIPKDCVTMPPMPLHSLRPKQSPSGRLLCDGAGESTAMLLDAPYSLLFRTGPRLRSCLCLQVLRTCHSSSQPCAPQQAGVRCDSGRMVLPVLFLVAVSVPVKQGHARIRSTSRCVDALDTTHPASALEPPSSPSPDVLSHLPTMDEHGQTRRTKRLARHDEPGRRTSQASLEHRARPPPVLLPGADDSSTLTCTAGLLRQGGAETCVLVERAQQPCPHDWRREDDEARRFPSSCMREACRTAAMMPTGRRPWRIHLHRAPCPVDEVEGGRWPSCIGAGRIG